MRPGQARRRGGKTIILMFCAFPAGSGQRPKSGVPQLCHDLFPTFRDWFSSKALDAGLQESRGPLAGSCPHPAQNKIKRSSPGLC